MNYLKSKYIKYLTPGLTFKTDYGSIYCVVNNKEVLYIPYDGSGDEVINQIYDWAENYNKLVLADKELLDRFKL